MLEIPSIIIFVLITISTSYSQDFLSSGTSDTLQYKYLKYHKEFADTFHQQKCVADLYFSYPDIINNQSIEDTITKYVFGKIEPPYDVNEYLIGIINEFKKYHIQKSSIGYDNSIYEVRDVKVLFNRNNILTLSLKEVTTGGAHPQTYYRYKNFKLDESKQLTLNDLFVNNYYSELEEIAKTEFYRMMKLKEDANLEEQHFWFDNNKFHLNNNFYIAEDGFHFFYNNYEIRAYAYGPTDLNIPWSKINHILKSNIGS